MLTENDLEEGEHIQVSKLQRDFDTSKHMVRNKLSDKFNRRDVQFYDLYVKKEDGSELAELLENQFPLEVNAQQYYQDLEVNDFNELFRDEHLIT